MKNKVLRLIELANETLQLKDDLFKRVKGVALAYNEAANKRYNYQSTCISEDSIRNFSIDEGGRVLCPWKEFWSYGGYDDGTIEFPSHYLYDEEALLSYVKECEAIKAARDNKLKEAAREDDLRALEGLKKKLGVS